MKAILNNVDALSSRNTAHECRRDHRCNDHNVPATT